MKKLILFSILICSMPNLFSWVEKKVGTAATGIDNPDTRFEDWLLARAKYKDEKESRRERCAVASFFCLGLCMKGITTEALRVMMFNRRSIASLANRATAAHICAMIGTYVGYKEVVRYIEKSYPPPRQTSAP